MPRCKRLHTGAEPGSRSEPTWRTCKNFFTISALAAIPACNTLRHPLDPPLHAAMHPWMHPWMCPGCTPGRAGVVTYVSALRRASACRGRYRLQGSAGKTNGGKKLIHARKLTSPEVLLLGRVSALHHPTPRYQIHNPPVPPNPESHPAPPDPIQSCSSLHCPPHPTPPLPTPPHPTPP